MLEGLVYKRVCTWVLYVCGLGCVCLHMTKCLSVSLLTLALRLKDLGLKDFT